MTVSCPTALGDAGAISATLQAVDCQARGFAQSGYEALSASGSPFESWLTAILVIYVALLGWRLLLGGSGRASDLPMAALKIGAILALVSNWSLFQTLVFDLVSKTPMELTRLIVAPSAAQSSLVADPLGGLQVAHDQLTLAAAAFGEAAGRQPGALAGGNATAAQALWQAAQLMYLSTVGLFCTAMIAVAILTAVGPLFVALLLLTPTQSLFVGWVRALLAALLAPMLAWMASALMLLVLEPNLIALARGRLAGDLQTDTAMATSALVTVFALVQAVLFCLGIFMATGYRFSGATGMSRSALAALPEGRSDGLSEPLSMSRTERLAAALSRTPAIAAGAGMAADRSSTVILTSMGSTLAGRDTGSSPRRPEVRGRREMDSRQ